MIKKFTIWDLDGNIIDSMHRYRMNPKTGKIDLDFWIKHDIPEFIELDSVLPFADRYKADLLNPEVYVVIATARACVKGDANYKFIEENLGLPNKFFHRGSRYSGDNRGGAEIKLQGVRPLLNLKQFQKAVVHVYEDNIDYLKQICDDLSSTHKVIGHYNFSHQGH